MIGIHITQVSILIIGFEIESFPPSYETCLLFFGNCMWKVGGGRIKIIAWHGIIWWAMECVMPLSVLLTILDKVLLYPVIALNRVCLQL